MAITVSTGPIQACRRASVFGRLDKESKSLFVLVMKKFVPLPFLAPSVFALAAPAIAAASVCAFAALAV